MGVLSILRSPLFMDLCQGPCLLETTIYVLTLALLVVPSRAIVTASQTVIPASLLNLQLFQSVKTSPNLQRPFGSSPGLMGLRVAQGFGGGGI